MAAIKALYEERLDHRLRTCQKLSLHAFNTTCITCVTSHHSSVLQRSKAFNTLITSAQVPNGKISSYGAKLKYKMKNLED